MSLLFSFITLQQETFEPYLMRIRLSLLKPNSDTNINYIKKQEHSTPIQVLWSEKCIVHQQQNQQDL